MDWGAKDLGSKMDWEAFALGGKRPGRNFDWGAKDREAYWWEAKGWGAFCWGAKDLEPAKYMLRIRQQHIVCNGGNFILLPRYLLDSLLSFPVAYVTNFCTVL